MDPTPSASVDPLGEAIRDVTNLRMQLALLSKAARDVERRVRNNSMQEALDIGRPLTGDADDPYTHYLATAEASLITRAQGAITTAENLVEELRVRLHTPALQRP